MSEAQIYTKDQTNQQINNRLFTLNNRLNPQNVPFSINLLNPSEGYANDYSCGIYMYMESLGTPQMFIDLFIPVSYITYKQIVDKMNKDG